MARISVSPRIYLSERTGNKLSRNIPENITIVNIINYNVAPVPLNNKQWPDGFMYNETLLYNFKVW